MGPWVTPCAPHPRYLHKQNVPRIVQYSFQSRMVVSLMDYLSRKQLMIFERFAEITVLDEVLPTARTSYATDCGVRALSVWLIPTASGKAPAPAPGPIRLSVLQRRGRRAAGGALHGPALLHAEQ